MGTLQERLDAKTDKGGGGGCWIWNGARTYGGYGMVRVGGRKGRTLMAHRLSYELHRGPIPAGLQLDHLCRVRCCLNPAHLEPVTPGENTRRGLTGDNMRTKTHCPKGHPYDEANTLTYGGARECRTCHRAKRRRHWQLFHR